MLIEESDAATTFTDPTAGFRRIASAIALPLAFVFQLAGNSVYAWVSTTSGMTDDGGAAASLEMFGAFPEQILACTVLPLIGCLLAVAGLPSALRVLRPASSRLALWAVILMVTGYVCYFGIVFQNFDTLALAVAEVDAAQALDAGPGWLLSLPFFLAFVIGNLVGTLLLGLAVVIRGRRIGVPWWAGALIMGWTVGHIINIAGGGEWFAVGGGLLEIVGLAILASRAMRMSDEEWVRNG